MRQLPLDLALPPRLGRDDFLPADANAAALAVLEEWPAWPDRCLLLLGPPGSGKSHLAAIWAARAGAAAVSAADLRQADLPARLGPATLLDDADEAARDGGETALFHLLNLVREQEGSLLLTAADPPDLWGLRTPDLLSRLRLAPAVTLGAPDDALLQAVLVKLFADRQLAADEGVMRHLVLHLDRSLDAARRAVEALDRASLARRRRVTRGMVAEVLGAAERPAEGED